MSRDRGLPRRRWFAPWTLAGFVLIASSCGKSDDVEKPAVPAGKELSKAADSQSGVSKRDANKSLKTAAVSKKDADLAHGAGKQAGDAKSRDADMQAAAEAEAAKKRSAEKVRIAGGNPTFRIQRDYDQKLAVRIENVSAKPQKVVAEIDPPGNGLLGDFVGAGGKSAPIDVAAGGTSTLVLALFAQDARQRVYDIPVRIKDSGTGELLGSARLSVGVPLPKFSLKTRVGSADPGTLAVPVEVKNEGEALTDVTVEGAAGLFGRISFAPYVDHARLGNGETLTFHVAPVLDPSFRELKGNVTIRGAGQTQDVPLHFELPPGKRVFVATSASLPKFSSTGWYCTNNPNTNSSIGGPTGWRHHHRLPPIRVPTNQRDYGPPDDPDFPYRNSDDNKPIYIRPVPDPDNDNHPISSTANVGSNPLQDNINKVQKAIETAVNQAEDVGNVLSSMGDDVSGAVSGNPTQPRYRDQSVSGTRDPRGRKAYARYRPGINANNAAEASWAIVGGGSPRSTAVFAWHSTPSTPKGHREVLIWGKDPVSHKLRFRRPLKLSGEKAHARWPIVIGLRGRRALVLWEQSDDDDGAPSLDYCVSDPDLDSWSPPTEVPGAQAAGDEGNFDPFPVVGPDGKVSVVWQRGTGKAARLLLVRATEHGVFGPPVTIAGLPPGAARPVARSAGDGGIDLVFVAPPTQPVAGVETAVFFARIPPDGALAEKLVRLSPSNADAGEADLAVVEPVLYVAFRAGAEGASQILQVESHDGGATWTDRVPASPESLYAEFPSFVPRDDGSVDLRFYGDARAAGSGFTTIKRFASTLKSGHWTEPDRRLTHFPAIESAWLEIQFQPRMSRERFLPHELEVQFNGRTLLHQKDVVPEGNYLLPCDPQDFRSDERGTGHNSIGLRTRHVNAGHYMFATGFRLKAHQKFLERLVIAKDQQEADRLVAQETSDVNHSRPDVGLFNNHLTAIPAKPKNGDPIRLKLLAANVGEGKAEDVRINVYTTPPGPDLKPGSAAVGRPVSVGVLEPFDSKMVDVEFPYDGKERYYAVISCKGEDFDTENNVHLASFPPPPHPQIEPEHYGQDQELIVRPADDPNPVPFVRVIDAQSGRETAQIKKGRLKGMVPTGNYRLAVKLFEYEGEEILYPEPIRHEQGQHQDISLTTSIVLANGDGFAPIWQWEAYRVDHPKQVVERLPGHHAVMFLPPGEYRFVLHPTAWDNNGGTLAWPQTVRLERGQRATLGLSSGIELVVGERYEPIWKWEAVTADSPQTVVQWHAGDRRTMLLPPGRYRIAIHPTAFDNNGGRVVWTDVVEVLPDRLTRAVLNTGIELDANAYSQNPLWKWEVVEARAPEKLVQWQAGDRSTMLVPAGDYRIAIHTTAWDNNGGRLVWPQTVHVERNQRAVVHLASRIQLVIPERYGSISRWEAISADADQKAVQWQAGNLRTMLVPPGRYRIGIHPTWWDNDGQRLIWPLELTVTEGKQTSVALDSGIRFVAAPDQKLSFTFGFVDLKTNRTIQWGRNAEAVQFLPAGDYRVEVQRSAANPWETYVPKVSVEAGKVREVTWKGFPDLAPAKPKSSGAGIGRN
jgi:hypothetical protein